MFEGELFGLSSSEYLHFAGLIISPSIGFLFLYWLKLPLKTIPVPYSDGYTPPAWLSSHWDLFCFLRFRLPPAQR